MYIRFSVKEASKATDVKKEASAAVKQEEPTGDITVKAEKAIEKTETNEETEATEPPAPHVSEPLKTEVEKPKQEEKVSA